jgi:hypothetical protein
MRYLPLLALVAACSADDRYLWGDVMVNLSVDYCQAVRDQCGHELDLESCAERAMEGLCANGLCNEPVDEVEATAALAECRATLNTATDEQCYFLVHWAFLPEECDPVFDLRPEAPDAGP